MGNSLRAIGLVVLLQLTASSGLLAQSADISGAWVGTRTGYCGNDSWKYIMTLSRAGTGQFQGDLTITAVTWVCGYGNNKPADEKHAIKVTTQSGRFEVFRDGVDFGEMDLVNSKTLTWGGVSYAGSASVSLPPETVEKRLPIIFLPGVAGTELYEQSPMKYEVWPLAVSGNRFNMMLDPTGVRDLHARIVIGDVLRSREANYYGGLIDFLIAKGYKEYQPGDRDKNSASLFLLPYDWRLDCNSPSHFDRLDSLINLALQNNGAKKVVLLAHSMGGVIANSYLLSRPQSASKVAALITMGTPYWGSVKPFYGLVDGYDFGNSTVANATMKILAHDFPAAYFLLPRLPFIYDADKKPLSLDESYSIRFRGFKKGAGGIDDYTETPAPYWLFNGTLLARAKANWALTGPPENPTTLPWGVKRYVIVGTGNRTLDGYSLVAANDDDFVQIGSRRVKAEPLWGDGDITVPLAAAEIKNASQTYYVKSKQGMLGGRYVGYVSSEHGDLPANPTVQSIVWQIIDGKPPEAGVYDYVKPSWLQNSESITFALHSDAELSITDAVGGGRLGLNAHGGIDQTLPTGSFLVIGKAEYASLANVSDRFDVVVQGVRTGEFTLSIDIAKGGGPAARLSYFKVPVRKGTLAQLTLVPSQAASKPPFLKVTTEGRVTNVAPAKSAPAGSNAGNSAAPVAPAPPAAGRVPGGPSGASGGAAAGGRLIQWSDRPLIAARGKDRNGERSSFTCPPGGDPKKFDSRIDGTDVYLDDGPVCVAAVHAGLITFASGGTFTLEVHRPGLNRYVGSTRNGVTSGTYDNGQNPTLGAFVFVGTTPVTGASGGRGGPNTRPAPGGAAVLPRGCAELQKLQQPESRDSSGRITVEAALIHVLSCSGRQTLIYHYEKRSAFRVIVPPDYGHAIGGRDFASYADALAALAAYNHP